MGKREAKVVKKKDDYDFLGIDVSIIQFPEQITEEKLAEIREYFLNIAGYTRLVGRSVPFSFLEIMMPLIYYYGLYDMVEFLKSNVNSEMITKEYQDKLDDLIDILEEKAKNWNGFK
jgi:hypothetical protein